MKLKIKNPILDGEEKTYLTADYASGVSLTVRNNEGFTTNWFTVVGEPGQEQTEIKDIDGLSGNTTITVGGSLKFSHPKSTPVYLSRWDRLYVYRATSSSGTYSAVTNSETSNGYWDIEWEAEDLHTLVVDDSGASSDYYKWRFYNSNTATYSEYSGVLPGTGLDRNVAGFVIRKIRRNSITRGVSDEVMYHYMNDYQDLVYEEMPKAWWFSKEGTQVSTVANTYRYSITANWPDLLSIQYLLFRYIVGSSIDNTYALSFVPQLEFYALKSDANQTSSDGSVKAWTLLPPDTSSAKGYLGLHSTPATTACYIKPVYFFELTDIDSFDDTLAVPSPKGYEDYVLYRIYDDIKNDTTNADKYNARVAASLAALRARSKRQQGQRTWMRFRGNKGYDRLFGGYGSTDIDSYRENYW